MVAYSTPSWACFFVIKIPKILKRKITRKILPTMLTTKWALLLVKKENTVPLAPDFRLIKLIKNIMEAKKGKTIPLKYINPRYFKGSNKGMIIDMPTVNSKAAKILKIKYRGAKISSFITCFNQFSEKLVLLEFSSITCSSISWFCPSIAVTSPFDDVINKLKIFIGEM